MPPARQTVAEIYAANRERFDKMRGPTAGPAGTVPIGDRPGTTALPAVQSWAGTPAGAARWIALGAFLVFCFVHVAAEVRVSAD